MYTRAKVLLISFLTLLLSASIALAQVYAPSPGRPAFAQQELDQMLAPIALYPDALLSQILMAATYPIEIVEAARWSRRNPDLDGDRAVWAVERMDWDPSVKSLVAFPQILTRMDENLDWTERLGDAFLAQQADMMDSVQYLRQKAYQAGNLSSTEQFRVDRQGPAIVIELANPELIYVPYYNPAVIYGTWWWPSYQPVVWTPWPGYHVRPGVARGYAWGTGIRVSRNFFFGSADWHRRSVNIVNVNNYYYKPAHARTQTEPAHGTSNVWQHNPAGRRDVPYRDASLRQPSDRTSAAVAQVSPPQVVADQRARPNRERTHDAGTARATQRSGNAVAPLPASSAAAPQSAGSPPVIQAGTRQVVAHVESRPNLERAPRSPHIPTVVSQPEKSSASSQPAAPATVIRPNAEQRPAAADGAGRHANRSNTRGSASHQAEAPAVSSAPPSQPSGNAAAPAPSSTAAATPPEGNPRGHGGRARHQQ